MPYKNPKDILIALAGYPATIEGSLPAGAPKISAMLADTAAKLPLPDLPVEVPDLPAAPALPIGGVPVAARVVPVTRGGYRGIT